MIEVPDDLINNSIKLWEYGEKHKPEGMNNGGKVLIYFVLGVGQRR